MLSLSRISSCRVDGCAVFTVLLDERSDRVRTEDGYIIYKCLNGDSSAFGFLVDKYKAGVYAVAYERLHNFHDAEDIAQEVFLKAYRSLRNLRHWDSFASWLYRITLNLCRDWLRVEYRRPDREYAEDQSQEALDAPSRDTYHQELACESVREALDSLPESHRQILTLRYLAGMNSVEIARFAGVSPSAIRMRLSKARSLLKEEILAMMSATEQRLQSTLTLRIVDAVKRVRIQPTPRTAALPWGLSLAAGIIITFLSLTPQPNVFNRVTTAAGSPLHVEERIVKDGEIPVDLFEVSQVSMLASQQRDGDDTRPEPPESRTTTLIAASTDDYRGTGGTVADEESVVVEPITGLGFTRIYSGAKLDVIGRPYQVTVSHDGNFIFGPLGRMSSPPGWVVPLRKDQEPFKPAPEIGEQIRVSWSPDMRNLAFIARSRGDLFVAPFSPEIGRITGPAKKILEGTDAQKEFARRVTAPSWSPDGQSIAFSWAKSGNFDIWTIPATGGEPKQITSDPQDERSPFWLPNGDRILFSRDREIPGSRTGTWDVLLVPSEGGTAEKIIEDAYSPWGANGEWLAFRRRREEFGILRLNDMHQVNVALPEEVGELIGWSGNKLLFYKSGMEERSGLGIVPAYGGPSVELGKGIILNAWEQSWSPDGQFIVTEGGEGFAWIVPTTGGTPVKLILDPKMTRRGPLNSFSPDLTKYVFIDLDADRSLWVVPVSIEERRVTGSAVKISEKIQMSDSGDVYYVSWSPDSRRIAFPSTRGGSADIWTASVTGGDLKQLTDEPGDELDPVWSPGGEMIAYSKEKAIWVVPASGGEAREIAREAWYPAWSPDGKEIAFLKYEPDYISIMSLAAGQTRRIDSLKECWELKWSPDGERLAFRAITDGNLTIWVVPAAGGEPTRLAPDDPGDKYYLSWSPDGKKISYNSYKSAKVRIGSVWEADVSELLNRKNVD